ncbi:MAG: YbaK/EbsC family protein [Candidatus Dojkabacteria bacterium]|nr:YbaK/EbsC family protein [Candidatus Dojkabacteria bacterium]
MKPTEKLKKFLNDNDISYKEFHHAPVRTSKEAQAQRPDYTLSQGAKAIIVDTKISSTERKFMMLVLPANKRLNSKKARKILNCKSFSFASVDDVIRITGGILPGGVHPFGNLFDLPVYVDSSLALNAEIIFNTGDRSVSIAMSFSDFVELVIPTIESFAEKPYSSNIRNDQIV